MIRDIWIVEKRGSRCLFNKSYGLLEVDPDLLSSFLSGLNAFSEAELGDSGIESIEMGNMKWAYVNWENVLLLVAAADKNTATSVLQHQLHVTRQNFIEFFKIEVDFFKKWNGNVTMFSKFESKLDELIEDWKKESKVVNIAKMMNLLEAYQQILHAFSKILPAIKPAAREKLSFKMNDLIKRLPSFYRNISYGTEGWNILAVDVMARECTESVLRDGLHYILESYIIEMKLIFEKELFFEIAKKLVYPKLLADWLRIRELEIDGFLLKLFLS